LYSSTLDIIIDVLLTAGPLSLERESSDCINAFLKFISQQIEEDYKFIIDTEEKANAIVCVMEFGLL
jgi:hypothetical protein